MIDISQYDQRCANEVDKTSDVAKLMRFAFTNTVCYAVRTCTIIRRVLAGSRSTGGNHVRATKTCEITNERKHTTVHLKDRYT